MHKGTALKKGVVCNPRRYARNRVNENPLFDANFLVEIN